MTTKMYHRVSTVIAGITITILLSIIIVVWVQVGHGAFRSKQENVSTSTVANFISEYPEFTKSTSNKLKENKKQIIKLTHLDDGIYSDVQYVKPMKISPPLHDHDIMYDQMRNTQDHPPLRHHSGHFRHNSAEVWDPHPHYEIEAFGRKLDLELAYNTKFVSSKFYVTHMWKNFTQRGSNDIKIIGCFYSGKVKGEENSDVAVSLCNGMTGYIRTPDRTYHIEPAEKFSNNSLTSILHRIKIIPHSTTHNMDNNEVQDIDSDLCETKENLIIVDDDTLPATIKNDFEHHITKRDVRHDYLDESKQIDDYRDISYEKHRSIRDVPSAFEFSPLRRTGNQEYHIEIMIVADQTMAAYHSTKEDLIHYILTLMSHVALLYKHVTIGNPISLAVVNIKVLHEHEDEFKSTTSEEMLRKFCEYQSKHNQNGEHDIALLLTRESICKNSTAHQCNTLGVAEVGSMCNTNSSCAIVKDKGLSTSYTISHELGHALSMPHDDDKRCLSFNGGVSANNVMSKVLQNDTKPWLWSTCSKHFLTDFLESTKASCLLDAPDKDYITKDFEEVLPGETFEIDKQCELEFGDNYTLCPYAEMPPCASLWCTTKYLEGCKSQHMPWADGTQCGEGSWCHHGECIVLDRNLLQPIQGGWGIWQKWESCSRTCGGGIKMSRRACDSPPPVNGGAYCVGRSIRYASCNPQSCELHSPNFREVQCTEFNGNAKGIPGLTSAVEWVPKYGLTHPDDYCKLFCRVKHSTSYYMLKEKVIDGTKCAINSFDICVHGVCRPGGCDNLLGSKATLDECGVCGGDNSKCTEISGTYNVSNSYGYTQVVRIPKGSSNVYIQQRGYQNTSTDENYLALVDPESETYILNGNYMVSAHLKDVVFGGMTVTYSGSEEVVEHIKTPKNRKLNKDLILEVLSVGRLLPPDITYRYTIKRESHARYAWKVYEQQWSECNSLCSGKQYIRPICVETITSTHAADNYCIESEMHSLMQEKDCNTHCRFEWQVTLRGQCSAHCGEGTRSVFYSCYKMITNLEQSSVHNYLTKMNDRHCSLLPKMPEFEICHGSCESTRWKYDEWTTCSQTCGEGLQRRSAICVDTNNRQIGDSMCNRNEKVIEQICNTQKCPAWLTDDWSPCSVTCGKGYRTRPYYCHVDGQVDYTNACDPSQLPVLKEDCNERPCVLWYTSKWSECNVTCGEGLQQREVFCHTMDSSVVDNEYCNNILKPNSTKACFMNKCEVFASYKKDYNAYNNDFEDNSITLISKTHYNNFNWATGTWSNCTKKCNSGTKSRMVVCRNAFGIENNYNCKSKKPIHIIDCNIHSCPQWSFGAWSNCDSRCFQHRQVSCQNDEGTVIEDENCDLVKPNTSKKCNTKFCMEHYSRNKIQRNNHQNQYYNSGKEKEPKYVYKWKFDKWGRCSKSCGRGNKTRNVRCTEVQINVTVVDTYCTHMKKPRAVKRCEKYKCHYMWIEGIWSDCSQACGPGFQTRNVTCHKVLRDGFVNPDPTPEPMYSMVSPYNYCDLNNMPLTITKCINKNCNDEYYWYTGLWNKCSQPCGKKGRQMRSVFCIRRDGTKVKPVLCSHPLKPKRKRKCNEKKCIYNTCKEIKLMQNTNQNKDYYILINNKAALIYCYKMDTEEPEEFISLNADVNNFAEIYDKTLIERNSCPSTEQRQDNCNCETLDAGRSGHTVFWKVRLNITTLRIIGNDFTFSKQIKGKKVDYGTSGDCYSEIYGCIQGRFSIDLTDTSFKLSRKVRWIENGNKASSKIDIQDQTVIGRCGGYCASCLPDPNYGLALEVT